MRFLTVLFVALVLPGVALAETDKGAPSAISQHVAQLPGPQATVNFPPDKNDSVAMKCDELADSPSDPLHVGSGVAFENINVGAALPPCEKAAARLPVRPRYQYLYGRILISAQRYDEALRQFTIADHAGYALATDILGYLYAYGLGVPQDPDKAASLYMRAGDGGVADSFADLGLLYVQGASPDYSDAIGWYQRAINAGSDWGRVYLGECAANGCGVPKDLARAFSLFDEAARHGNRLGMFDLGMMYRDGLAVEKDPVAALKWFNQAVAAGELTAAVELGNAFYFGRGVAANHKTAFNWYLRAANADVPIAQRDVALSYDEGDGVTQSAADAVTWYRKAAEQGDPISMTQLSHHLRQGRGVTANVAESWQWLTKAAEAGFPQAETELGTFYQDGSDYTQAAHWFGEAVKQGDGFAEVQLGWIYQNGWGVDRNPDEAHRLFTLAAASPDPGAASLGETALWITDTARRPAPQPDATVANQPASRAELGDDPIGAGGFITPPTLGPAAASEAPRPELPQTRSAEDSDDSSPPARHLPPRPSALASNRSDATAKAAIGVGLAIGAIMAIGALAAPDSPNANGPWCPACTDGKGLTVGGGVCLLGQPGCN